MSKVGSWVLEMQEDAQVLTLEEFVKKHGAYYADIWYEFNGYY